MQLVPRSDIFLLVCFLLTVCIEGPLFFGSIDEMLEGADAIEDDIKKLVIDLMHVQMIT